MVVLLLSLSRYEIDFHIFYYRLRGTSSGLRVSDGPGTPTVKCTVVTLYGTVRSPTSCSVPGIADGEAIYDLVNQSHGGNGGLQSSRLKRSRMESIARPSPVSDCPRSQVISHRQ